MRLIMLILKYGDGKHVSGNSFRSLVCATFGSCNVADSPALKANIAKPLSRYAPCRTRRSLGDFRIIPAIVNDEGDQGYSDLPPEARRLAVNG